MGISEEELSDQKALETWGPRTWPSFLPLWEPSVFQMLPSSGLAWLLTWSPAVDLSLVVRPKWTISPRRDHTAALPRPSSQTAQPARGSNSAGVASLSPLWLDPAGLPASASLSCPLKKPPQPPVTPPMRPSQLRLREAVFPGRPLGLTSSRQQVQGSYVKASSGSLPVEARASLDSMIPLCLFLPLPAASRLPSLRQRERESSAPEVNRPQQVLPTYL